MVYIKTIELENFKSFFGRTKLEFIRGFNIIAGANGSGKSNVIDAFMFVFGASSKKEMRSDLLVDLIFNGGKERKPADSAKVTITFDNSEGLLKNFQEKEVSISRKIDSSGKSVFRINGKASTREEILNLLSVIKFRQDGFNIIPQGRITEIANSSPEDKLAIINDISGISVFEDKKSKAMNEMKKVEENMSNIDTVLKEKKRLMDELDNEKKKAVEFKELKAKSAETAYKLHYLLRKRAYDNLNEVSSSISEAMKEKDKIDAEREKTSKEIEDIRNEIERINERAEKEGEAEIKTLEKKARELESELIRLDSVMKSDKDQLIKIEDSLKELEKAREEIIRSYEKETKDVEEYTRKLNEINLQKTSALEEAAKIERYLKEKEELEKKLEELTRVSYEYKLSLSNYPKTLEVQQKLEENNKLKYDLESKKRDIVTKFSSLEPELVRLKQYKKQKEDRIYWLKENLLSESASIHSKSKSSEVADKLKNDVRGVYGSVGQLFSVKNEIYSEAIYRSIGRRSDFIVVDSDTIAAECINKLKKEKLGIFNFIPLNKISAMTTIQKPDSPHITGFTIDMVGFEPRFERAMRFVFSDTLLVDSFDGAKDLIGQYRMVTMDGTVFEKSGVISGGHYETFNLSSFNKKVSDLKQEISKLTAEQESLEKEITEKESSLNSEMSEIKLIESQLATINLQISRLLKEKSTFKGSEAELSEELRRTEEDKRKTEMMLERYSKDILMKADVRQDVSVLDKNANELEIKLKTSLNKIENVFKIELSNFGKRISELEKERSHFQKEIAELAGKITGIESALKESMADLEKSSQSIVSLRKHREELSGKIYELEEKMGADRKRYDEVSYKINNLRVKEAELKVKFETEDEEFKKLEGDESKIEERDSIEELKRRLSSIQSRIAGFGPINELAVERFDKVAEEFAEFNEKMGILGQEKEKIMSVIADIEAKKMEAFMKTISDINSIFEKVFNSITNGHIKLVPDNPQNIFEGGLDIEVSLPNKKVNNVRGLSGGEISLVSIALLLSISKYIDVPFYILDEVDAALDSINSSQFSNLIKAYSESTEFIVISHNENTLIGADVIYGVVMDATGASKVVSIKLPKEQIKADSQ
ncbi:chromosome segregation protein SMC [Candidatus Parvarchaeota archaeon]|nr:chromosome segregation protein SMC [Candidatus Parvarchaeota archaeon]